MVAATTSNSNLPLTGTNQFKKGLNEVRNDATQEAVIVRNSWKTNNEIGWNAVCVRTLIPKYPRLSNIGYLHPHYRVWSHESLTKIKILT